MLLLVVGEFCSCSNLNKKEKKGKGRIMQEAILSSYNIVYSSYDE